MPKIKEKPFDAVKMMREIRDKISAETQGMNLEELQKYMAAKAKKGKTEKKGV